VDGQMWTTQQFVTLFWVVLGGIVAISSYRLGLGKLLEPGPGLMPLVLGVVMCILALFKLMGQKRAASGQSKKAVEGNVTALRKGIGRIAVICAALFAYAFLLDPFGYLIITFVVMAFLLKAAGQARWLNVLAYSAVITLVSYFGFGYLGTRFPPGLLSFPGF
jgi:putative tricarboxylic transport membrane protein